MFMSALKAIISRVTGGDGGSSGDEYFNSVTLLLHMNGTDESTTFDDDSSDNRTVTAFGNAQIDTSESKFGGASGLFDGTGDYLTVSYVKTDFDWWGRDFTFECWVHATAWTGWDNGSTIPVMIGCMDPTAVTNYWSFGPLASGKLGFFYYNGGEAKVASTGTLNTDEWVHIAMTYVHSTTSIKLWINGSNDGSATLSGTPLSSASFPLSIGSYNNYEINGWVDDIRITSGVARYTSTFTPPTNEFPNYLSSQSPSIDILGNWWGLHEGRDVIRRGQHQRHNFSCGSTSSTGRGEGPNNYPCLDVNDTNLIGTASWGYGGRTGGFAVCAWVTVDNPDDGIRRTIMSNSSGTAASQVDWYLRYDVVTDEFEFVVSDGSTLHSVKATTFGKPSADTWYFIYAEYDGTSDEIGISVNDGTLDTATGPTTPSNNDPGLDISYQAGQGDRWKGRLAEVCFWESSLTASNITWLYNSGLGRSYYDINDTPALWVGNEHYFDTNETSGTRFDTEGYHDLTQTGGTVGYATGILSNAIDFDGSADYIRSYTYDLNSKYSFTISQWISPDSVTGVQWITGTTNASEWRIRLDGTTVDFEVYDTAWRTASAGTLSTGTWYHIVGVYDYDANTIVCYVDAVAGTPTTGIGTLNISSGTAFFGCNASYGDSYDGLLDEFSWWGRVLSSTDISDLYNAGSGITHGDFFAITDPTDISGCITWLDASDRGTTTNQWDDKSGNDDHWTSSIASEFPSFAGGIATFDGANDHLDGPDILSSLTSGEVFILLDTAHSSSQTGSDTGLWFIGNNSSNDHYLYANQVATSFGMQSQQLVATYTDAYTGGFLALNCWAASADWALQIDGASLDTETLGSISFTTTPTLGKSYGSYYLKADVKAFIIYNRKLTSEERGQVKTYLDSL